MQNKIIRRMAGDRHHLYEMQQLEKLLYTSFDLDVFYEKLIKEAIDKSVTENRIIKISEIIREKLIK